MGFGILFLGFLITHLHLNQTQILYGIVHGISFPVYYPEFLNFLPEIIKNHCDLGYC
jgi:hypothetical protein